MDGFEYIHVIIVYAIVIGLTALLFVYKKWYKRRYKKDYDERTMSLASGMSRPEFKIKEDEQ